MRKKKEKGGEGLSGILFENFFLLGLLLAFFVVWLDYFFFFLSLYVFWRWVLNNYNFYRAPSTFAT